MSYCPSKDWDNYAQQMDLPDECPVCRKPNYDEENDKDIYPEDPAFCSAECAKKYHDNEREVDEAMARSFTEEQVALGCGCDWGYCNNEATTTRKSKTHDWLPVCDDCKEKDDGRAC